MTVSNDSLWLITGLLTAQCLYVLAQGYAWAVALRLSDRMFRLKQGVWVFLISVCIEVLIPFSSIGSDSFKVWFYRKLGFASVMKSVLFFRVVRACNYCLFFCLLLAASYSLILRIALAVFCLSVIFVISIRLFSSLQLNTVSLVKVFTSLSLLHVIVIATDLLRVALLLSFFQAEMTASLAVSYLCAHVVGMLSQLPLGLGVKDAGLFIALQPVLTLHEIPIFIMILRLSGEGLNVLLGYVLGAKAVLNAYRDNKENSLLNDM